ncbi:hypothetical protein DL765_011618 [Monosporascus sp. GIB2]|nr:hypothetical protein DL765_011618 [Monosporascus sp. GIB2]
MRTTFAALAVLRRRDGAGPTSHVEGLPELGASDRTTTPSRAGSGCAGTCSSNPTTRRHNVQPYRPGLEVDVKVRLTTPHAGRANVKRRRGGGRPSSSVTAARPS